MLGNPTNRSARLEAKKSLQIIGHKFDDATLDQVEKLIAGDVDASMAYAYHRIYNYAIDLTYQHIDDTDSDVRNDRKNEVSTANKTGNHELMRIADFAT